MKKKLRVAVLANRGLWGGAVDLIRLWLTALIEKSDQKIIDLYLVLPEIPSVTPLTPSKRIRHFLASAQPAILGFLQSDDPLSWKIFRIGINLKRVFLRLFSTRHSASSGLSPDQIYEYFCNMEGRFQILFCNNHPKALEMLLKQKKVDVCLPTARSFGKTFAIPWIGYIYDFQDKLMPYFFQKDELRTRDYNVANMLSDAKCIMVNSKTVKDQVNQFYPGNRCEIFALPFAPFPQKRWLTHLIEKDIKDLSEKYTLPEKYFIISNQFWRHKSHITAFEALRLLIADREIKDIHIVCTGNIHDYRHPQYFKALNEKIREMGIASNICFLGHIPKLDQIIIMYNSIAVLQPTLLEGGRGGGCVYDAVAIGVPVILSDIPINLEIKGEPDLYFFKVKNKSDLSEKMLSLINKNRERICSKNLEQKGRVRIKELGDELIHIIEKVVN